MSKRTRKTYTQTSFLPQTLVTVIIPVYRRFDILAKCLESLPAAFDEIDYEVIIIDNGSPVDEKLLIYPELKKRPHYRIYEWTENRGFPKACNFGAKNAASPLIFFLNSDVIMSPHSGAKTVALLDDPKVGVAGMKLLFSETVEDVKLNQQIRPSNMVQHIGIAVNMRGELHHVLSGWSADNPKVLKIHEVHMVTGAALMTRKSLFTKVGGFFEGYGMGCLTGDTLLITDQGIVELQDLMSKDGQELSNVDITVASEDRDEKANLAYINGEQETLKVCLEKAFSIQGTLNHRVRVMSEDGKVVWKQLDEIKIGDFVGVRYGTNLFGIADLNKDDAYFMGAYIANGSNEKQGRITISTKDESIHKFLSDRYGFTCTDKRGIQCRKQSIELYSRFGEFLDWKQKAITKQIPSVILHSNKETQVAFLQGLFDGDGCAIKDGRINYSTSSYRLAQQLQIMLLNFGIVSGLHPRYGKLSPRVNYLFDLGSDSGKFYSDIGFRLSRKQERSVLVRDRLSEIVPYQRSHFKALYSDISYGDREYKNLGMHATNPSDGVRRETIELLIEQAFKNGQNYSHPIMAHLGEVLLYKCVWMKVKSIEDGGIQPTFDLHIPRNNAYVANGLIVHNTFEDCDYCLTIRKLGYNIVVDSSTYAIHYTGATSEGYQIPYPINQNKFLFMQRWMSQISYSDWVYF